jgi:superfamily I DNA/RNA helicase
MKNNCFIYFDVDAIEEILKIRELQSIEYNNAIIFIRDLFNSQGGYTSISNIAIVKNANGTFCFNKQKLKKEGIVFDLETLTDIKNEEDKNKLIIILKTLRFGVKLWNRHPMTNSEQRIPNTSQYCLMPLPFTKTNYYKILIETKPDARRMEKRGMNSILCYKDGHSNNRLECINANPKNLRKVLESIEETYNIVLQDNTENQAKSIENYKNFYLMIDKPENIVKGGYIGYDNMKKYLTEPQKKFIHSNNLSPSRIEGPAGSGKTISLVLRGINLIKKYMAENSSFHIIFFTHSISTKDTIKSMLELDLGINLLDRMQSSCSITVTTMLEWCINKHNIGINIEQCLEPDAFDSKQMQLLYIEEVYRKIYEEEYLTYSQIISDDFKDNFEKLDDTMRYDLLQKEFSIFIKGQANQDLEKYKQLQNSVFKCRSSGDRAFVFRIFSAYQKRIEEINQFDVDDVILTTMGFLNSPIWKRLRNSDGYDYIILDETQLFNFNELSLLQYVNKEFCREHVCFSQDLSQTQGDIGFTSTTFQTIGEFNIENENIFNYETVFRCTSEIAQVAFKILSSGPTLLVGIGNPLENIQIVSDTISNDMPSYCEFVDDAIMIDFTYKQVDNIVREKKLNRSDILIICTCHSLLQELEKQGRNSNKPIKFIEKRGDSSVVQYARQNGQYVGALIDFVGGLEFEAVIIIGVDAVRIPNDNDKITHFQMQSWVNKLYVAITRARSIVEIYANKTYNSCKILESSLHEGFLKQK